jgi:YD repeat-containing protein
LGTCFDCQFGISCSHAAIRAHFSCSHFHPGASEKFHSPPTAQAQRAPLADSPTAADPVNLETGLYIRSNTDLYLKDSIPIQLTRTYRNADSRSRAFGIGASHSFEMFIVGDSTAFTYVDLILADGSRIHYNRISPGRDFASAIFEHASSPTPFYRSRIKWNGAGWTVTLQDGSTYKLLACNNSSKPGQCGVVEFRNARGEVLQIQREKSGNISRITSPGGKWVALSYDSTDRIVQADDSLGRSAHYTYDGKGRLVKVLTADGKTFRYQYDDKDRMTSAVEGDERILNVYDGDRCVRQTWWKKGVPHVFKFKYVVDEHNQMRQTDVREPDGSLRRVKFNANGYTESQTYNVARRNQINVNYDRDLQTNSLKEVTVTCAGKNSTRRLTTPIGPARSGEVEEDILMSLCGR